jgi:hypothetical protein
MGEGLFTRQCLRSKCEVGLPPPSSADINSAWSTSRTVLQVTPWWPTESLLTMSSIVLACLVTLLSYIQIRVALMQLAARRRETCTKLSQSCMCFVSEKTDSLWQRKCNEIVVAAEDRSEEDGRNVSRETQDVQHVKKNKNRHIRWRTGRRMEKNSERRTARSTKFIDLITREQEMSYKYCRIFLRHFEGLLLNSFFFFTQTVII